MSDDEKQPVFSWASEAWWKHMLTEDMVSAMDLAMQGWRAEVMSAFAIPPELLKDPEPSSYSARLEVARSWAGYPESPRPETTIAQYVKAGDLLGAHMRCSVLINRANDAAKIRLISRIQDRIDLFYEKLHGHSIYLDIRAYIKKTRPVVPGKYVVDVDYGRKSGEAWASVGRWNGEDWEIEKVKVIDDPFTPPVGSQEQT